MKKLQVKYSIAGILFFLAGVFLVYKNSWGKYIDPWLSRGSRFRGQMSYWFIVAGIGLIIAAVFLIIFAFSKNKNAVENKVETN